MASRKGVLMNSQGSRAAALRRLMVGASLLEMATGLGLLIIPGIGIQLLLGIDADRNSVSLGRIVAIALLCLGLACWPGRRVLAEHRPALRGMLAYNTMLALYLAALGAFEELGGPLLWPAVALHAAVAIALVAAWRAEARR